VAFWSSVDPLTLLFIVAFALLGRVVLGAAPALQALGLPQSLVGGALAFLAGPALLGWVPFDPHTLEAVVYHGLALVFIAFALQPVTPAPLPGGARSIAFAIPWLTAAQGVLGLVVVLLWPGGLHPGFGMMLPLGFSQGPGQALSMGKAWESMGMTDGSQIGLAVAAMGFVACSLGGVLLVAVARRRGWLAPAAGDEATVAVSLPAPPGPGELDRLAQQLGLCAVVYLGVYAALTALSRALAGQPQLAAMVWGFHFLLGLALAVALRFTLRRAGRSAATDPAILDRVGGSVVDLSATAAIAAISLQALRAHWAPILVLSVACTVFTLFACVWLARRTFDEHPFAHALTLYGTMTGTLPTGLALLRAADPALAGPVPRHMLAGVAASLVPSLPLLLVLLPMPVLGWPESHPGASLRTIGGLLVYLLVVGALWRRLSPFRLLRPIGALWPDRPAP
jgi:ESS family glutamate:Na+ symporter